MLYFSLHLPFQQILMESTQINHLTMHCKDYTEYLWNHLNLWGKVKEKENKMKFHVTRLTVIRLMWSIFQRTKTILPVLTIITMLLLLLSLKNSLVFFFYVTDPVQSGIFIFSCQNCVSIALTCTNYHEIYAMLSGLKNKIF